MHRRQIDATTPTAAHRSRGSERALRFPFDCALQMLAALDLASLAAFVFPFTIYVCTMAPTVYNLDSAEFTTAAATGGLVRATGYPLYLLVSRVWSMLPVSDAGYRMNLFSAFSGALTIFLAERILRRMGVGRWASFAALGLLATAPYFWALSLIAEVYTLHTALMAGLLLALVHWAAKPTPRRIGVVGLMVGLGLTHHASTILLLPGCLFYIAAVDLRGALAPRSLLLAVGGLAAALSLYAYLPIRYGAAPAFNYAGSYDATGIFHPTNLRSVEGLWWLVSGQAFQGQMLAYRGGEIWREVGAYGVQVWRAFFVVGVGPGMLGLAILLRRDWRLAGLLLLAFVCNAAFYINFRVADKVTMFLPTYLVWSLWLGVGCHWLLSWVKEIEGESWRRAGLGLVHGIAATAVVAALVCNWRLVDLSDDWSARTHGQEILATLEPNALLLGWWDTVPIVEYLQLVEGHRPDVQVINRFLISYDDTIALVAREAAQRPVYIDSLSDGLLEVVEAEPAGSLQRLTPKVRLGAPLKVRKESK